MRTSVPLALAAILVLIAASSAPARAYGTQEPGVVAVPAQAPSIVRGRILCDGQVVDQISVVVDGKNGQTSPQGHFQITAAFTSTPTRVYVTFDANIKVGDATTAPRARLQIMNDAHDTRNESVDRRPTSGDVADFGNVELDGDDCVLWNLGAEALRTYYREVNALPPAGELRIKRWEAVYMSASAAPHTFYDYIVAPTDLARNSGRRQIIFHEFGHSLRQVADGSKTHWDLDNVRFIYARLHNGSQVTDKGFAFNEGWAHYWSSVAMGRAHPVDADVPKPETDFLDWNEDLVGEYLRRMALGVGPAVMVRALTQNPERIHTLYQFEEKFCAIAGPSVSPAHCKNGRPVRARPAACPPGYHDDGATCRLENIQAKPSYNRGAGTVPKSCGAGKELDAGLCYPTCPAGYKGVGPVCWQNCPSGYKDDGATCRRDASIIRANNGACPGGDKCGLTYAKGCSTCPAGYKNDGCTCRRNAHIFGKDSRTRGAGKVPTDCAAGQKYDAGLCYPNCRSGYTGVGPICWGKCPAGMADHGATCYRDPNVFSDDGV